MERTAIIRKIEEAIANRKHAASTLGIFENMLRRDEAENNQHVEKDRRNVARFAATLAERDAELDAICAQLLAARPLPVVDLYARRSPATAEEPAEEWHEIHCPTCRDWFVVEYTEGAHSVRCGGCDMAFEPRTPEAQSLPVEAVNQILVESLPAIQGIRFLGAIPR